MEWLDFLEWYCEALNLNALRMSFDAKLAGVKFR